jgi:hypothetical protein
LNLPGDLLRNFVSSVNAVEEKNQPDAKEVDWATRLDGDLRITFDDETSVEISTSAPEDIEISAKESTATEGTVEFRGNVVVKFKAGSGTIITIRAQKAKLEK